MARPIWTGTLSFGLLNVPVSLMSAERSVDLHFRMLDSRDNTPVRYERVNAETGDEVPWKEIVKAFEYEKGSYVVLEPEDLKSAASEGREAVEVEAFVDADSIGPEYFEKPYVLVPGKKAEKGYVLFRETLKRTGKIGIARVVIRTREYLSAVMPRGDALMLLLLRYPQELIDTSDYRIPAGAASKYRISAKEMQMAEQLIDSMSDEWKPAGYRDEFRDRLRKVIEKRLKSKGLVTPPSDEDEAEGSEDATTNVVDFMALLQKSLAENKRTPAKKAATKKAAVSASKAKPPAKKAAKKKAPAKKVAKRTARTAS
jgi:DNA end-binding protein Ku